MNLEQICIEEAKKTRPVFMVNWQGARYCMVSHEDIDCKYRAIRMDETNYYQCLYNNLHKLEVKYKRVNLEKPYKKK